MRNRNKTSIKQHKIVILKGPLPFLFGCPITLSVELQQMLKTRQTQPTKTFIQQHEFILRLRCLVWCLLLLYRFISFCFVSCFFLCVLIIVCAMWATRTPRNNGAQWCWWFVVWVWIRMNCYANCMDVVSKRFWTFLTLSELFWIVSELCFWTLWVHKSLETKTEKFRKAKIVTASIWNSFQTTQMNSSTKQHTQTTKQANKQTNRRQNKTKVWTVWLWT
jgi:hypothetical protein